MCMHKIEWTWTTTNNNEQKLNLVSETSYALTVSFIRSLPAVGFLCHLVFSPFGILFACCLFAMHPIETAMELFLLLQNIFIVSLFRPTYSRNDTFLFYLRARPFNWWQRAVSSAVFRLGRSLLNASVCFHAFVAFQCSWSALLTSILTHIFAADNHLANNKSACPARSDWHTQNINIQRSGIFFQFGWLRIFSPSFGTIDSATCTEKRKKNIQLRISSWITILIPYHWIELTWVTKEQGNAKLVQFEKQFNY